MIDFLYFNTIIHNFTMAVQGFPNSNSILLKFKKACTNENGATPFAILLLISFCFYTANTVSDIVFYVEILHHLQLLVISTYLPIATTEFKHVMRLLFMPSFHMPIYNHNCIDYCHWRQSFRTHLHRAKRCVPTQM